MEYTQIYTMDGKTRYCQIHIDVSRYGPSREELPPEYFEHISIPNEHIDAVFTLDGHIDQDVSIYNLQWFETLIGDYLAPRYHKFQELMDNWGTVNE